MKRTAILFLMLLTSFVAGCQTITGKNIVVEWDAPTNVPPEQVSYEVGFQPYPSGSFILVATVAALECQITFPQEGDYRIGVRALRTVNETVLQSEWSWSDIDGSPSPWYVRYLEVPNKVMRLRVAP